jgi:hypothetical protein
MDPQNSPTSMAPDANGTSSTKTQVDKCFQYCQDEGLSPDELRELSSKLMDEADEQEGSGGQKQEEDEGQEANTETSPTKVSMKVKGPKMFSGSPM